MSKYCQGFNYEQLGLKIARRPETCWSIFEAGIMSANDSQVGPRIMSKIFFGSKCERSRFTSTRRPEHIAVFSGLELLALKFHKYQETRYTSVFPGLKVPTAKTQ